MLYLSSYSIVALVASIFCTFGALVSVRTGLRNRTIHSEDTTAQHLGRSASAQDSAELQNDTAAQHLQAFVERLCHSGRNADAATLLQADAQASHGAAAMYSKALTASMEQHKMQKSGMLAHELWHGLAPDAVHKRGPMRSARFTTPMKARMFGFLRSQGLTLPSNHSQHTLSDAQQGQHEDPQTQHQAPSAGLCWPAFNVQYKYVLIRTTKTGGTSVQAALEDTKAKCTLETMFTEEGKNCIYRAHDIEDAGGPQKLGYASWGELWQDYFVFAPVRNPYDRAGSAFEYLHEANWPQGTCTDFAAFAAHPWALGAERLLQSPKPDALLASRLEEGLPQRATHDWYHVEPQTKCLVTPEGALAVDMLIRAEHSAEDMQDVLAAINTRRPSHLPALNSALERLNTVQATKHGGKHDTHKLSRHAEKYEECGDECARNVERYYAADFELLGYPQMQGSKHA